MDKETKVKAKEKKKSANKEKKEKVTEETEIKAKKTKEKKEVQMETENNIEKENEEEPEKPIKETEKTEVKEKKSFPWVNLVLFIVLIGAVWLVVDKIFLEEPKQGEWDTEKEKTVVEIKNFFSSECSFCEKENSIIANFEARGLETAVESIDLAKEENQHYIEEFNLTLIPTALVNAENLAEYPFEENLIKQSFTEKNGFFVIPESYLDNRPHNLMLLEAKECSEALAGKVFVEQFCDYQTLGCALIYDSTKKARENFAGEIIFRPKTLSLHEEKSELTAIAAECAREQGRFLEYDKYFYEKAFPAVFDINRQGVDNSTADIIQVGTLLFQIPDKNAFNSCIQEKKPLEKINQETQLAKSYGANYTPSLVFDCKYIVQGNEQASKIEEIICELHPELESCKIEVNESN